MFEPKIYFFEPGIVLIDTRKRVSTLVVSYRALSPIFKLFTVKFLVRNLIIIIWDKLCAQIRVDEP